MLKKSQGIFVLVNPQVGFKSSYCTNYIANFFSLISGYPRKNIKIQKKNIQEKHSFDIIH